EHVLVRMIASLVGVATRGALRSVAAAEYREYTRRDGRARVARRQRSRQRIAKDLRVGHPARCEVISVASERTGGDRTFEVDATIRICTGYHRSRVGNAACVDHEVVGLRLADVGNESATLNHFERHLTIFMFVDFTMHGVAATGIAVKNDAAAAAKYRGCEISSTRAYYVDGCVAYRGVCEWKRHRN